MKLKTIMRLCLVIGVMGVMALAMTACGGSSDSGDQDTGEEAAAGGATAPRRDGGGVRHDVYYYGPAGYGELAQ